MISAFGIDHGISKGLPRHLQDIAPVVGASGTKKFRGGEPLSRGDYSYLRIRAHQHGKTAGRLNQAWKKQSKEVQPNRESVGRLEQVRREVVTAGTKGRMSREGARKAVSDNTPIVRPKKPRKK